MKPQMLVITAGAILGVFVARALEVTDLLPKFGFILGGMAVAFGMYWLVTRMYDKES